MKFMLKPEALILLSSICYSLSAIIVKLISVGFSSYFIAFSRFTLGLLLGILVIKNSGHGLRIKDHKNLFFRGLFGAFAMISWYTAITMTSSGRATLLNLTYPVFVAVFGYMFFSQKIHKRSILSLIICSIGVVLVFYDGSPYSLIGNLIGLASGMFAGMAIHYIKRTASTNDPEIVYMSACAVGFILTSHSITEVGNLTLTTFLILLGLGSVVFIGQMLMTTGFKMVSASRGAITLYSTIPLTLFFSYLIIGEEMTTRFLIGTIVIIIGLLNNMHTSSSESMH